MKLNEISTSHQQHVEEVMYEWFGVLSSQLDFNGDGTINVVDRDLFVSVASIIPVKIHRLINGDLALHDNYRPDQYTKNLPTVVQQGIVDFNKTLISAKMLSEIAPLQCDMLFYSPALSETVSLTGIHRSRLKSAVIPKISITSQVTNVLGLCLIPGVDVVEIVTDQYEPSDAQSRSHRFSVSHHDVHKFQEELLDAGLVAQAKM